MTRATAQHTDAKEVSVRQKKKRNLNVNVSHFDWRPVKILPGSKSNIV